jgi:transposase
MERVDEQQIVAIERELSAKAVSCFSLDLRCLLFDATNFFTFVDSFNERSNLPQRGHSKEGRDNLRILGLALLVTSDGDVPLFHQTYAGNQHDSVTFQSVSQELADRCRLLAQGAHDVTLVFDKGNNSDANLDAVSKGPFHFVGSLVPTHYPDLLAIPRKKMRRLDTNQLPAVWSCRRRQVVFGVERTVLCTFNQPLFDAQKKTLQREIRKRKKKLRALETKLENRRKNSRGKAPTVAGVQKQLLAILNGRHMKDLFDAKVSVQMDIPRLNFRFLEESWRSLCSTLLGKTILFTDREDWSDEEIVLGYRSQSHVEAAFRRMKDPHCLTFRPTFHWTDQKLRVHAFYCVLALMIASLLCRKINQAGIKISLSRMIERLSDIREVILLYSTPPGERKPFVRTVLSELDDEKRALIKSLGIEKYQSQ